MTIITKIPPRDVAAPANIEGATGLIKARRHFDRLREAIRRYDAEATEDAWLDCEQWLEMVFARVADADTASGEAAADTKAA